jgi:hypothetical protein
MIFFCNFIIKYQDVNHLKLQSLFHGCSQMKQFLEVPFALKGEETQGQELNGSQKCNATY